MGQFFMPMTGGIFKRNAHILAGLGLFTCCNPRCGTRRVSAGEGLGIRALDLIGPAFAMFDDLVNYPVHGILLTLVDLAQFTYLSALV
jgi:hypothetical protein